jgi:cytochrome c biogenesis protein CcmG/thiol:disulfide interchange protein DsbE
MAIDTTPDDPPRARAASATGNPVPLIVAGAVALGLAVGVLWLTLSGDEEEPESRPVTLGEEEPPESDLTVGEPAPDVRFEYFDGEAGGIDDFRGTPVVLNFFATWCAPCVEEMPGLQTVSEEYASEVQFLGMDVNDPLDAGRELVESTGVEYAVARDPGFEVANAFRVYYMPTTVFIDDTGTVARVWVGEMEPDEVRQVIERDLLGSS